MGQRRSELEAELAENNQGKRGCGKSWKRRKSNCRRNRRVPAPNSPNWRRGPSNCRRRRPRWSSSQAADRSVGPRDQASGGAEQQAGELGNDGANWKRNWRRTSRRK